MDSGTDGYWDKRKSITPILYIFPVHSYGQHAICRNMDRTLCFGLGADRRTVSVSPGLFGSGLSDKVWGIQEFL